jgi:hypothetical protein
MAPEKVCATDMLVLVRWQGRKLAVPLAASPPCSSALERSNPPLLSRSDPDILI